MSAPAPTLAESSPPGLVWHVGRRPEPWAWVPWEFAGRQRWDDFEGSFRTVYAADSRYGCFVEVLAPFRPDPQLVADLAQIEVDPSDVAEFPTRPAGQIDRNWIVLHLVTSAELAGVYCDVTAASTVAQLRPQYLGLARRLGLPDFDAAALKLGQPRELTQRVATEIYERRTAAGELFAGIRFASRHGDDLAMCAIFERVDDAPSPFSRRLVMVSENELAVADPELTAALELHGLSWPPV